MNVVAFPYIEPSFKAALNEVIAAYLTGGGSGVLGGMSMDFYDCEIHWNMDMLGVPSTKPRIAITGSRSTELGNLKCQDQATGRLSYVRRQAVYRSVYVSIPRSLKITRPNTTVPRPATWEDADNIWSQLHAIISTKYLDFADRNILRPTLTPTPLEVADEEYLLLYGAFNCEVRFGFLRD